VSVSRQISEIDMQPETILVLATRNRGKTEEIRALLGPKSLLVAVIGMG